MVNQERSPNFRDKDGALYLVRCFRCDPERGYENYALSVSVGECHRCGWREGIGDGICTEQAVTWQHDETGMTFTKNIPINEPIPSFPRRGIIKIEWVLAPSDCQLQPIA